jgi:hypothetical protein
MFLMNLQTGLSFQAGPQAVGFFPAPQAGFRRVPQPVFSHGKNNVKLPETFWSFGIFESHLWLSA